MIKEYNSPSGYVTLYNYKEPFMEFENGFGYQGVLLYDKIDGTVQCHLCGKWFNSLGHHVNRVHNMKASEYKYKVGLNQSSALISEEYREKMLNRGVTQARIEQLEKNRQIIKDNKKERVVVYPGNSREKQNKTGNCPMQLLDRIKDKATELGRTPTALELEGVVSKKTVVMVFGSMEKAISLAGLQPRKKGEGVSYKTYTKDEIINIMRNFKETHQREPLMSDSKRGLIPSWSAFVKHFGSFNNAKNEAFSYPLA
jgi:hypothetical protein